MNKRDKYRIIGTGGWAIITLEESGITSSKPINFPGPYKFQRWSGMTDAVGRDVFEGDKVMEKMWGRCIVRRNQNDQFDLMGIGNFGTVHKMPTNPYNILVVEDPYDVKNSME